MLRWPDADFALLGVNSDEDIPPARELARSHGVSWPTVFEGDRFGPIHRAYGIRTWPSFHLIDRQGIIREIWAGPLSDAALDAAIEAWIAR